MLSSENNKAVRCDTCHKIIEKSSKRAVCGCKRFRFCDDICYSNRPMRDWHKEECGKKVAERKAKDAERQAAAKAAAEAATAAAISVKRSEAAKNQSREPNGQFGKTPTSDEEKAAKNRLNSATSKCVKDLREEGQKLHSLRENWQIRILAYRNEKGCKTDPVIFETKNFNNQQSRNNPVVSVTHDLDHSNTRTLDLSYEEEDVEHELFLTNQRKPSYRCYICHKLTGPRKGFVCAEREENQPCQNGAACIECINLDMNRLSPSERKTVRNNWRCPKHKTSGRQDPVEEETGEELDVSAELPKKKTKRPPGRKTKLLTITDELRRLLPEALRDKEHFTRTEINKGVHLYIKTRPDLKVVDPESQTLFVKPDEALAAVYGTEPFKVFSRVPQLKSHVKETGLYFESSQNLEETPSQNVAETRDENMAGTNETTIQRTSSTVKRSRPSDTEISPDESASASCSSDLRVPRKYLKNNAKRILTFKTPVRFPAAPAVKGRSSEENDDLLAVHPEDVDERDANLPCKTCMFPLFKETEEMKKEPIKNKKKVIYCPVCEDLIHESCYLGLTGCETCSK